MMTSEIVKFQIELQGDGEPRVSDAEMAWHLGYSDIKDFRALIRRHEADLVDFGILRVARINDDGGRGRPGRKFWLDEHQATYLIPLCGLPQAKAIHKAIVRDFIAYRRQARHEPKLLVKTFLLADEARRWERAYSDRFFIELHRVGGWKKPVGNNHSNCAHFINRYVYLHLLGQLGLQVVRDANPANDEGARAHKHHSMLKSAHMPVLRRHIERIEDMLVNSVSLTHFDDAFNRTFPKPETQMGFLLQEAV